MLSAATPSAAPTRWRRATQLYYRNYLRQHFVNWDGERDAETLQQLHAKARTDAQWVLDKVRGWIRCTAVGCTLVAAAAATPPLLTARL